MPRWEVESRGAVAVLTRPPRNFMLLIARPRFDGLREHHRRIFWLV
jgi:hypothetical protein